ASTETPCLRASPVMRASVSCEMSRLMELLLLSGYARGYRKTGSRGNFKSRSGLSLDNGFDPFYSPANSADHLLQFDRARLSRGNITASGCILRGRDRAACGDPPLPAPVSSAVKPARPAPTPSENAAGFP